MNQLEEETRALCEKGEFDAALRLCDQELSRAPQLPSVIILRKNIVDCRRMAVLEMMRRVSLELSGSHSLQQRVSILEAALVRFPDDPYLNARFAKIRQEAGEVQNLISMSRSAASEGRFEEAYAFLDTVESLESRNPDPTVEKHDLKAERHSISLLQEAAKLAQKKSRLMTDIRAALNRRNFDRSRGLIRDALLEFPGDEELSSLQERCSQLEDASIQAMQLFHDGRTHIQLGNHEVGIEKFRCAGQLDPDNRDIQSAHFDALIQFAKSLGEEEPKRARYLLDLAARISPYNLALENAAKYLSEKRRDKAVRDCTEQVTVLRESCELEKALQLVEEVAERHKLRSDPELAGLRLSLLEDLGFAESVRETQDSDAIFSSSHAPASGPSRLPFEQEPPTPMEPNLINRLPWAKFAEHSAKIKEHARWMREHTSKAASFTFVAVRQWLILAKASFLQLPLKIKLGVSAGFLISLFATAIIGMTNNPEPKPASIGTGTMLMPATLLEQPSNSSRQLGRLKAGQSVEILSSLPAMSLESWVWVHPTDQAASGYVQLRDLDRIHTSSDEFNLWHAMTFLNRPRSPADLIDRVSIVDNALKTEPLMPSRETDRIFMTISKAFVRVAQENLTKPDVARLALDNADAYLSHITGALILTDEAEEVKASVNSLNDILGGAEEEIELEETDR